MTDSVRRQQRDAKRPEQRGMPRAPDTGELISAYEALARLANGADAAGVRIVRGSSLSAWCL